MGKKIVLMVFVASLLFSSYASAEVIKLKFANYFPPMHMNSVMMGKYCEELNVKLAGKVELTQYAGGTLLTAPKMAAGVASWYCRYWPLKLLIFKRPLLCHGNYGTTIGLPE